MKSKYQKDLKLLMRKYESRCSICKIPYDLDTVVFTCIGYDAKRKLQATTGCCFYEIKDLRAIGLCGCVDPEGFHEIMESHPMFEEFSSKKNKKMSRQVE